MWAKVYPPVDRIVCHCLLVVAVPASRVDPRQDWDGHDHAAHPGRHVRSCQTKHSQGKLCLCSGCVDVQLHCVRLLHSPRVCHYSQVSIEDLKMKILLETLSLMYRRVKPDEEIRSSDNDSSSIGIQAGGDKNVSDSMDNHTVRVEEGLGARRSRPRYRKMNILSNLCSNLFTFCFRFCPMMRRRATAQCRPREIKNVNCTHQNK